MSQQVEEWLRGAGGARPRGRLVVGPEEDYELVPRSTPPREQVPGLLGQGTYGKVWRYRRVTPAPPVSASNPVLFPDGPVAIKALEKRRVCATAKSRKHVMVEIAVLKNCTHPNIISLYEIMHNQTYIYLVMEYCGGGELYHFISSRRLLAPDVAAKINKQVMMGLEYLHGAQVVHRDMKPENILIDSDTLHVKLIDFGLSKHCGVAQGDFPASPSPGMPTPNFSPLPPGAAALPSPMIANTPCGTELYSALESISGILDNQCGLRPWRTTKSALAKLDVYGAGVICYAMLTGKLPFRSAYRNRGLAIDRERRLADLRRVMQQGLQFPPAAQSLPVDALNCVRAMMDPVVSQRVNATQCLQLAWLRDVAAPDSVTRLLAPGQIASAEPAPPAAAAESASGGDGSPQHVDAAASPTAPKEIPKQDNSGFKLGGLPVKKAKKKKGTQSPSPDSSAQEITDSGPSGAASSSQITTAQTVSTEPAPAAAAAAAPPQQTSIQFDPEEDDEDDPGTADPSRFRAGWAEIFGCKRNDEDDDQDITKDAPASPKA